jgi:hypothetical protein
MSSAEETAEGSDMPDAIISYLLALTRDGGPAPESTVLTFVEPRVQAGASRVVAGALEVLQSEHRLLLWGAPGAGKSTAIRVLARQMARAYLDSASSVCPVLVAASALPSPGDDPWEWLASAAASLAGAGHPTVGFLAATLKTGDAHLFVDGLDEVPDARQRSLITGALGSLAEESPGLKICISARPAYVNVGDLLGRFAVWSLLPFDEPQARHLLSVLTGSQEPEVERQLAIAPHLGSLAGNPLYLRLLSLYSTRTGLMLPRSRVELFEDLTDAILAREQKVAAHPISAMTLHRGHEIASETMARAGTSVLSLDELATALTHYGHDTFIEDDRYLFLRLAQERIALLVEIAPGRVSFVHKSFQEFYLGRAIARDVTMTGSLPPGDLSAALLFAAGLADNPLPIIIDAYKRHGAALAARCCNELRQDGEAARRALAEIVVDDLGADLRQTVLGILQGGSASSEEASEPAEGKPFAALRQVWDAMPRKGAPADARGRGLEQFAAALLGTYFEVIEVRRRLQAGEIDVLCENPNSDPFWASYSGDIWVECKNTERKATLEQVNTFLGKLMASRGNLGIFFSVTGFTKDAMDRLKAVASNRSIPLIAPITGTDIEELLAQRTDLARFFKAAIRNVA